LPPLDGRRTIGFLISDVARMMRSAFDRRVRRLGLTRSQWLVLSLLHRRPGVSQSELAEMLEVERAAAGRMIDRLERRNWLVRRPDPIDRRINRLYLTAEAEAVQAEMGGIAVELLDDAMASLAAGERAALGDMLERMKARLQGMGPRPATPEPPPPKDLTSPLPRDLAP
jgi:MarR family transcriptional regulator for hemolysin